MLNTETLLVLLKIWLTIANLDSEKDCHQCTDLVMKDIIKLVSLIPSMIEKDVMQTGLGHLKQTSCNHYNGIDQYYYCLYREIIRGYGMPISTNCKQLDISNWNNLDIEERRIASECVTKELKTWSYITEEGEMVLPGDFFTNELKFLTLKEKLSYNLMKCVPEIK